jgi:hypothetical protein
LVGFFGFIDSYFLGHGAGSFIIEGVETYYRHDIGGLLGVEGWYRFNIPQTLENSPLAIFPVILFEYGFLGLAFIIFIFFSVIRSKIYAKYVVAALLFLTWVQSFPAAFPLFWLLLGLIHNRAFAYRKSSQRRWKVALKKC